MRTLKNLLVGFGLLLLALSLDNSLFGGSKMKKALSWLIIAALLIICVRIVLAQGAKFQKLATTGQCSVVQVEWQMDSVMVQSWGCADFGIKKDTLVVIPFLVGGMPKNAYLIPKEDIKSITLLQEKQTANLKPRIGGQ